MARPLISDELWELIAPLLPVKKHRFRHPGRKPIDNQKALSAVLVVLRTGIPWEHLPQEVGRGSGMTAWRRLDAWQKQGVWKKVHESVLARLQGADKIDWRGWSSTRARFVRCTGEKNGAQAPYRDRRERHSARGHAYWR